jgi:hypothetical protein
MRYRPLSALGDYTIGTPFLVDDAACVGQAILTRLKLWLGEFFLDTTDGTPWYEEILGPRATRIPDTAIKRRILGTPGVSEILTYSSTYDGNARTLTVNALVQTIYSTTVVVTTTLGGVTA